MLFGWSNKGRKCSLDILDGPPAAPRLALRRLWLNNYASNANQNSSSQFTCSEGHTVWLVRFMFGPMMGCGFVLRPESSHFSLRCGWVIAFGLSSSVSLLSQMSFCGSSSIGFFPLGVFAHPRTVVIGTASLACAPTTAKGSLERLLL